MIRYTAYSHYVSNRELLRRVLMIVRRIRNVYKKRNMDIAIHSPMNGPLMNDFKRVFLLQV